MEIEKYHVRFSILPAHVTKTMFIYKISWNIDFFTRNFVISRWMLMIIEDSFLKNNAMNIELELRSRSSIRIIFEKLSAIV